MEHGGPPCTTSWTMGTFFVFEIVASSAARRGAETQNASMAMAKPRRDSGRDAAS